MLTDTWFVAAGALVAHAAAAAAWPWGALMLAITVASFLALRLYVLPGKRHYDRARLPFYFRLTNFPRTDGVLEVNRNRLEAFVEGKPIQRSADGVVGRYDPPRVVLIQG